MVVALSGLLWAASVSPALAQDLDVVATWGWNQSGQLGDGSRSPRANPVRLDAPRGIAALAAGRSHSLALDDEGGVWGWGQNRLHQLGSDGVDSRTPIRIAGVPPAVAISAGEGHSLALTADGSLWAWGSNSYGQLGSADRADRQRPVALAAPTELRSIAAGRAHSLAADSRGRIWAWGNNEAGQVGASSGRRVAQPQLVDGLPACTAVAAGGEHSLALDEQGGVWTWGSNGGGQLGDGTATDRRKPARVDGTGGDGLRMQALAAGEGFSLALAEDGTVWAWGHNFAGQLGTGDTRDRSTPTMVAELGSIVRLAAGRAHAVAMDDSGTIWTWGFNGKGQGGVTAGTELLTPVRVRDVAGSDALAAGASHSMATVLVASHPSSASPPDAIAVPDPAVTAVPEPVRTTAPEPSIAARPAMVQATAPEPAMAARPDPVEAATPEPDSPTPEAAAPAPRQERTLDLDSPPPVRAVAVGGSGVVTINSHGTLVQGGPQPGAVPTTVDLPATATAVALGADYAVAVLADGSVAAWGANHSGQLGSGDSTDRLEPARVRTATGHLTGISTVATGMAHVVALASDGTVWGWGDNSAGQLIEGGPARLLLARPLPDLPAVRSVAAGGRRSAVVTFDGRVLVLGTD